MSQVKNIVEIKSVASKFSLCVDTPDNNEIVLKNETCEWEMKIHSSPESDPGTLVVSFCKDEQYMTFPYDDYTNREANIELGEKTNNFHKFILKPIRNNDKTVYMILPHSNQEENKKKKKKKKKKKEKKKEKKFCLDIYDIDNPVVYFWSCSEYSNENQLFQIITKDPCSIISQDTDPCECETPTDNTRETCSAICLSVVPTRRCLRPIYDCYTCFQHRKMITQNIQTLSKIYHERYQFDAWTQNVFNTHPELWKESKVYYDEGVSKDIVIRLSREREPVNIGLNQYYNKKIMQKEFKWNESYYKRYYTENKGRKLPPNIGIYTPTILQNDKKKIIHVYNAVGYAFDHKNQVDYKYFFSGKTKKQDRDEKLKMCYRQVFEKIFYCAMEHKMSLVVMSLVGCGFFAEKYDDLLNIVWIPAFIEAYRSYQNDFTIVFMGTGNNESLETSLQNIDYIDYIDVGYFPQNVTEVKRRTKRKSLEDALFVNAWDPHSIPGNGHKKDNSLDGHIGRHTHIALSGNLLTNPLMQFISVKGNNRVDSNSISSSSISSSSSSSSSRSSSSSNNSSNSSINSVKSSDRYKYFSNKSGDSKKFHNNAYQSFSSSKTGDLRNRGKTGRQVSRLVDEAWTKLSEEQKKTWVTKAAQENYKDNWSNLSFEEMDSWSDYADLSQLNTRANKPKP